MLEMSWIPAILQLYSQVTDLLGNVIVKRINIRLCFIGTMSLHIESARTFLANASVYDTITEQRFEIIGR